MMIRNSDQRGAIQIAVMLIVLVPATTLAVQRTFVSAGSGNDSNPCTRTLPCRQFTAAMTQTDPGGEVVVLDSGGYGEVSISQSVALVAPAGVHAAITALTGNAININAMGAGTDVVILRGLYLNYLGGFGYGIEFQNGETLHVENCVVSGFSGYGIFAWSPGAEVFIKDTTSRENGAGAFAFGGSFATVKASLDSIRAEESQYGVLSNTNSLVTVTRGIVAGNSNAGFFTASGAVTNIDSCTATFNLVAIHSFGGTTRVANSMITGNGTGVITESGGSNISFGNNRLHGNTTDGAFSSTISQQ